MQQAPVARLLYERCQIQETCTANAKCRRLLQEIIEFKIQRSNDIKIDLSLQLHMIRIQINIYRQLKFNCQCCHCPNKCVPCLTIMREHHHQALIEKYRRICNEQREKQNQQIVRKQQSLKVTHSRKTAVNKKTK